MRWPMLGLPSLAAYTCTDRSRPLTWLAALPKTRMSSISMYHEASLNGSELRLHLLWSLSNAYQLPKHSSTSDACSATMVCEGD